MSEIKEKTGGQDDKAKYKALKDLNMNESEMETAVVNLNSWLQYQSHLPHKIDTRVLKAFIVGCRSAELAKEKLEQYFIAKITYPLELSNLNPFEIKWDCIQPMAYLPDLTPEGCVVLFLTMPDLSQTPNFDFVESLRFMGMMVEYMFRERPYITGQVTVTDLKHLSLKVMTKLSITTISNALNIFDAYPYELVSIYNINTPQVADTLQKTVIRPIMKDGIYNMITSYTEDEKILSKHLPLEILPREYGGKAPSLQQIMDDWRVKLEGASAVICGECCQLPDESKIPKKNLNKPQYGTSGTFRKLNID